MKTLTFALTLAATLTGTTALAYGTDRIERAFERAGYDDVEVTRRGEVYVIEAEFGGEDYRFRLAPGAEQAELIARGDDLDDDIDDDIDDDRDDRDDDRDERDDDRDERDDDRDDRDERDDDRDDRDDDRDERGDDGDDDRGERDDD